MYIGVPKEPTLDNTVKVTNFGEIVVDQGWVSYYIYTYDESTGQFFLFNLDSIPNYEILNPDIVYQLLHRFVDTSSDIDIIGYKYSFTNLPGNEVPKFELRILCSDSPDAQDSEWHQIAYVKSDNNILFLTKVKRYVKFVVSFDAESDLSQSNFLLLVQVNIDNISVPVMTDHARNVLSRFPSWTKMYADSLEKATPELAIPDSFAGKVVNALLGEDLDNVDRLISDVELDSFISTADLNQVAWLYVAAPVRPGFIKVIGDSIELGRVDSYFELLNSKFNDWVFHYDYVTQQLFTLKPFNNLYVDSETVEQSLVQVYNSFDEFGFRVGLQRLYQESNINFKNRILDVYINPPSVDVNGLKKTLRRELDIWRAYNATPDSYYLGATPEIFEISDIKGSSPYFELDGNPTQLFHDFVDNLNKRFPANLGYSKWNETYWDYAGSKQEGVSSIPQTLDMENVSGSFYQPGVGDFDDAKIVLEKRQQDINQYSFGLRVKGIKSDTYESSYEPIDVQYDSYISYYENYIDNEYATINYDIYLKLNSHGNIPNDSVYKTSITDITRNIYNSSSSASPEFKVIDIFNQSNYSEPGLLFVNSGGTPYSATVIDTESSSTHVLSSIPLYAVSQATINYVSSQNSSGATADYGWIRFFDATPTTYSQNANKTVVKSGSFIRPDQLRLTVGSKIYNSSKRRVSETNKVRSSIFGNTINNSNNFNSKNNVIIYPNDIIKQFLLPAEATPIYVHIENVVDNKYDIDLSASPNAKYGGVSLNREDRNTYLIPSSPSIWASFVVPNFATPQFHENYINTVGSTVNYYFTKLKFPYGSTPNYLAIDAPDTIHYPFQYKVWQEFEAEHVDQFSFYLSENGVSQNDDDDNSLFWINNHPNLIGQFNFLRSEFGLEEYDSSENLIIKSMEIINENDNVIIWQENQVDASNSLNLNYLDEDTGKYIIKEVNIRAKYDLTSETNISPSIKSGWYYQNGEEGFIYADPVSKIAVNSQSIDLDDVVRNGSPVIVNVNNNGTPSYYRQVSFYEESTPSNYSYYNFEYITATNSNVLYLAYADFFDASVVDTYTGETVLTGFSSTTNEISVISTPENPPFIVGRKYRVLYRVNNAFYLDNQIYDTLTDEYKSRVYLLSTPNSVYSATVSYESAVYDKDFELNEIKLNPLYSQMDQGYLYLSHNTYTAASVDAYVSPKNIMADGKDFIILNIFSKDINNNPKPNQTYSITGPLISATPAYVTTDNDGFSSSRIQYNGSSVSVPNESLIYINGLPSASPNSHPNSESGGISATVNYYIEPQIIYQSKLLVETDKKIITADGTESVNIYGKTEPLKNVYWRKARTVYDALKLPYSQSTSIPGKSNSSGMVTSNSNGQFSIGEFIAQNDATPGYWFVVVDSELSSTSSSTPVTITGDITYWYEKYDALQTDINEDSYIPVLNNAAKYRSYTEEYVFKADAITGDIFYEKDSATPWNTPKWYPINRITQYQLGLFGSTPNIISSLSTLHPDYEEE